MLFSASGTHLGHHVSPALQTQLCLLLVSVLCHQVLPQDVQAVPAPPSKGVVVGDGVLSVVDGSQAPVGPQVDGVEYQVQREDVHLQGGV